MPHAVRRRVLSRRAVRYPAEGFNGTLSEFLDVLLSPVVAITATTHTVDARHALFKLRNVGSKQRQCMLFNDSNPTDNGSTTFSFSLIEGHDFVCGNDERTAKITRIT